MASSNDRQSVASGLQSDVALAELCVHLTLDCANVLEDASLDLEEQNKELKRIGDAISFNRLYVLLPERRVREYSIQQSTEIEPQITDLLQLAEKSVKNLERKEATLVQKIELQKSGKMSAPSSSSAGSMMPLNESEERRKKMLIKQRHIFEKELASLENECIKLQRKLETQ